LTKLTEGAKAQKDVNNSDDTVVNNENVEEESKKVKEESKEKDEEHTSNKESSTTSEELISDDLKASVNNINSKNATVKTDNETINSNNNESKKSNNYNLYIIIGVGVVLVVIVAILFVKFNSSTENDIPTGKRSITKRFTLRDEVAPPIIKYNDSWKNTLSKNKGFNTLPSTINRNKSTSDEETEQLINDDNLITDAEKFARKHGLTDTEWVARKDYIPYREDELEIYQGNRIKVFELYDDLWCYGMNLDHYGTLSNDNEGMFPSSVLPIEVITQLLSTTKVGNEALAANEQGNTNEVTIDCNEANEASVDESNKNENQQGTGSQFTLPKPLAVPLMPPKPLPSIPNLNRNSSLRSSVHRKRNSNPIDPSRSPLIANRVSQISNLSANRHSQLSTLSNEIEINPIVQDKPAKLVKKPPHQNKMLFISTGSSQKESKHEDVKHLLSSPESDLQNKSTDESLSAISPTNLKQKQPAVSLVPAKNDEANTSITRQKDEILQQQLLIQKQREQLQQQQLEQQKLQEQLKQQQLHQQLQQQQIEMQIKQLQQLQQEKERQLLEQKQQLQQQFQQQQKEQEQLRIQREQQQIIQKSKLKEIEYERERLLQESMSKKQDHRDSILPSYSEAVNTNIYNNFASSSSGTANENLAEGFPLPPNMTSPQILSPVSDNSEDQDPELYPRNTSYKHQIQKRDLGPEDYPRNISRSFVDEHPSIGRKIKQNKNEEQNSNSKEKSSLKQKEAMNYQ